jgi:hypothetical protein
VALRQRLADAVIKDGRAFRADDARERRGVA